MGLFNDLVVQVQRTFTSALGEAPRIGVAVVGNLVIILILSLYMVLDSHKILRGINRLIPDRYDDEADLLERSVARAFGGFLRAQVILAGIQAVLVLVLGIAIGLPYLFLIVAVSSVFMLVPFFGPPLALVPPLVATAIYQPAWIVVAAPVLLIVQTVVVNWLQPKLMHGALGLHPLLVLIGLLVGAQVAGVWGALFGIPVIAVVNTFVTYVVNLAVLHDTAEVEAAEVLEEARREAPADAPVEEIVALAADKAEEAHNEARAEEEAAAADEVSEGQRAVARAQAEPPRVSPIPPTSCAPRAASRVTPRSSPATPPSSRVRRRSRPGRRPQRSGTWRRRSAPTRAPVRGTPTPRPERGLEHPAHEIGEAEQQRREDERRQEARDPHRLQVQQPQRQPEQHDPARPR